MIGEAPFPQLLGNQLLKKRNISEKHIFPISQKSMERCSKTEFFIATESLIVGKDNHPRLGAE